MRLLLGTDAVGGVWRHTLELAAGLSELGVGVVLAVLGPAPGAAQRAEARAVPGLRLIETALPLDWTARDPTELAGAASALRRLAAAEAVDGVHLHAPALLGEAPWPMPVVAVAHSDHATWWAAMRGGALPPDLAWRADATAAGLRGADAAVAPSHAMAEALRRAHGDALGGTTIRVVYNGLRPPAAAPPTQRARVVLAAGRLWDEAKGIALLDRAAAGVDAPVLAAGALRGPNGEAASFAALRPLGLLDAGGMAAALAGAAVFCSPARYEPFGLAVLEAAQAGCALVLSDTPGFRELWDGAALFADPHDAAALAATLRRALAEAAEWGPRALERSGRFGREGFVDATLAVHRELAR